MTKVTFLSEDGQRFMFETREKNEKKAIKKAEDKLKELNYDMYNYSLQGVQSTYES